MRYALLLGYDGTLFSGWQRQKKGERTVQGELERAAEKVLGVPTRIVASGRTDAGVHAYAQVCTLDAETALPPEKLAACFDLVLPPDIRVYKSCTAPDGFDCTRGARRKTYCYRFYTAETELPVLDRYAVRISGVPCLEKMRAAADMVCGKHDFKAFCAAGSSVKTTERTIFSVEIRSETQKHHTMYGISVTGDGFLYNMVRILAGELIAIGLGKGTEHLQKALETGERSLLAKTMPARGLMLMNVEYGVPLFGAQEE